MSTGGPRSWILYFGMPIWFFGSFFRRRGAGRGHGRAGNRLPPQTIGVVCPDDGGALHWSMVVNNSGYHSREQVVVEGIRTLATRRQSPKEKVSFFPRVPLLGSPVSGEVGPAVRLFPELHSTDFIHRQSHHRFSQISAEIFTVYVRNRLSSGSMGGLPCLPGHWSPPEYYPT